MPAEGAPLVSLRVAMLSVHTSPLHQPGTGDAGGMNVYMVELSRALAEQGVHVDLFTRCRGEGHPPRVELVPGVRVRHLHAGPCRALPKEAMPGLVLEFALALLKAGAGHPYDLVHSHYWLSGQAGTLAAGQWQVPLVHTMHTMARVKNASLAPGDQPEPELRIHAESRLAVTADRLIANTPEEAVALRSLYGAAPHRIDVVTPGVDTRTFHPADGRRAARVRLGLPQEAFVPLFAGRIQPLKGPDVLVRAVAELLLEAPDLRRRLLVPVVGGLSGSGTRVPGELRELCGRLGLLEVIRFERAVPQVELADWYRAADVLVVPSRSESFGLVALEAQACGTPVLAAAVGGLPTAVRDGESGLLVGGHEPGDYARGLLWFARHAAAAEAMGVAAERHAQGMSWCAAAQRTLQVYERALENRGAKMGQRRRHTPAPAATPSWRNRRAAVPA
ncbi:D-inositol-3-phosphate glycosyltransferase [Streptomyces coeruleorubidus]|uniref:D-inositol-3-phosphate glycosyltransferase n=1 Tax=Streptomyces coeruleorubidus TaxID=116188 RepID=UPI0037B8825C